MGLRDLKLLNRLQPGLPQKNTRSSAKSHKSTPGIVRRPLSRSSPPPREAFERAAVSCGGQSDKYSVSLRRPAGCQLGKVDVSHRLMSPLCHLFTGWRKVEGGGRRGVRGAKFIQHSLLRSLTKIPSFVGNRCQKYEGVTPGRSDPKPELSPQSEFSLILLPKPQTRHKKACLGRICPRKTFLFFKCLFKARGFVSKPLMRERLRLVGTFFLIETT